MRALHLHVGDTAEVGNHAKPMRVVGEALLPATSHTDYDQSGWMTAAGLHAAATAIGPDDYEDYIFLSFHTSANADAADKRLAALAAHDGFDSEAATLPTTVIDLGRLRALPLALAVFFAFLAVATVAHALVTTVRRRGHELAVLRSLGLTRRESRTAIAWQSTLLALAGLVIGLPVGIVTGRVVWRWLAQSFPLAYAAPLALVALVLSIPIALAVANLLAAGPAHAATRISPARALRAE
jgi:predicted lysophospholipase L1 biosynthesis ABC-type transport system permease subunit